MKQTLTIAQRELSSLFFSPIAYVVVAAFALLTAVMFFVFSFRGGGEATMRSTFEGVSWLLILLVPALSMRLISEEFRSGTIETLMTAPLSDTQVILGKWLGAAVFLVVLLSPLVVFIAVLEVYSQPDYGPIFTGLLGLLLVGGLYLAIGTFASAVTKDQLIAFLLALLMISCVTVLLVLIPIGLDRLGISGRVTGEVQHALFYFSANEQFQDFKKGLIDVGNFVYFLSGIALFLFLAVKLLESRRWR